MAEEEANTNRTKLTGRKMAVPRVSSSAICVFENIMAQKARPNGCIAAQTCQVPGQSGCEKSGLLTTSRIPRSKLKVTSKAKGGDATLFLL